MAPWLHAGLLATLTAAWVCVPTRSSPLSFCVMSCLRCCAPKTLPGLPWPERARANARGVGNESVSLDSCKLKNLEADHAQHAPLRHQGRQVCVQHCNGAVMCDPYLAGKLSKRNQKLVGIEKSWGSPSSPSRHIKFGVSVSEAGSLS